MAYGKKNVISEDPTDYNIGLIGESGIGKEQPVSEPVLCENGWRTMGDIQPGDKVYGRDGKLHTVTEIYPQGVKNIYRITFADGTSTRCGLEHLWTVITKDGEEVVSTREMIDDYKDFIEGGEVYKYSVPVNEKIEFTKTTKLPIDPFSLGYILTHGTANSDMMAFGDPNDFFVEEKLCRGLKCSIRHGINHYLWIEGDASNLAETLEKMDVINPYHRSIPTEYLYADSNSRHELFSGLFYDDRNLIVTSGKFAEDIAELVRGLGYIAIATKIADSVFEINVYNSEDFTKAVTAIKLIGKEEAKCIMLDSKDHTYITKDYIVTHNTTVIKEFCENLLSDDGYLFVETGHEDGTDAIEDINWIGCPSWDEEEDKVKNTVGFSQLIDDILTNKDTDYPNLKTLVIDTYDQLKVIADKEIVRRHNRDHADKKVKTIKAAYGGYNAGDDMADDLIIDMLWSLKKVGVHFIIIGHVRQKDITDPMTGELYTQLTTDLPVRNFNKIKNKLDILGVACIDRNIVNKVKKKKTDGVKEVGHMSQDIRKIVFRDDSYAVDAKSRFKQIVPETLLNGTALAEAIKEAIAKEKSSVTSAPKKEKKVSKAKVKSEPVDFMPEPIIEEDVASKSVAEDEVSGYIEEEIPFDIDPAVRIDNLLSVIKNNFTSASADQKAKIKAILKDNNLPGFQKKYNPPVDVLEKVVAVMEIMVDVDGKQI